MDDVLAEDGHEDVVASAGEPFLARVKLHLHSERVGRQQRHEKHQDAWHKDRGQAVVVTALRVGDHVCVNRHGL